MIAYFGSFPIWFPAFLLSCKNNPNIHWKIWTDIKDLNFPHPENVTFIQLAMDDFLATAKQAINGPINISTPHKLCDFKPLYGDLFQKELATYNYWGHCDLDLIWGDIESFLLKINYEEYDIVTTRQNTICGHFTIYRNIEKINKYYTQIKNFEKVFLKPKYSGFDEGFFSYALFQESQKTNPEYKIFWPKKYSVDWPELNIKPKGWRWKNGKIIDKNGNERIYLHFMKWKKSIQHIDFDYENPPSDFLITKNGLWSNEMSFTEKIKYHSPTHLGKLLHHYWTKGIWFFKYRVLKQPIVNKPLIPEAYKTL